ncbi:putative toxin-antitoxin system toxin component, PIN family [Candidatus Woesearchaeota archaeon]|nr:putative toxin-antitoxin system toxin component, PIN family [Candidatus Woesearchaeota archaeon]
MGKKKIVADTNIMISALGWKGKPRELFKRILNKEFELITSQKQIEELHRVMNYTKFKFSEEQKIRFISLLFEIAQVIEVPDKLKVIKEDSKDNFLLETAVLSGAEYIISGDEHLLKLKKYLGTKITTIAQFFRNLY